MVRSTRGFTGRRRSEPRRELPPGQYDTGDTWPVLTAEPTPRIATDRWTMTVDGLVERSTTWSWDEIRTLPASSYEGAIHCVTTWSKFDMRWSGVSVDTLLAIAGPLPAASHVLAHSLTGYTANFPIADVTRHSAWVVWEVDGEPLAVDHGAPARLLVPHLYFWKSAKWVTRLELLDRDDLGFWERRGYHHRGDPWLEQRYRGD